jgi:hypothetical protein
VTKVTQKKKKSVLKCFLLSYLIYSQLSLSLLYDDHHFAYITEKMTEKTLDSTPYSLKLLLQLIVNIVNNVFVNPVWLGLSKLGLKLSDEHKKPKLQ